MKGLRYSPLHVTEFCGEMQGKFKVDLARLLACSTVSIGLNYSTSFHNNDFSSFKNYTKDWQDCG